MTQAPILRSAALLKALAMTPVRRTAPSSDFSATLATAQTTQLSRTLPAASTTPTGRTTATAASATTRAAIFHAAFEPAHAAQATAPVATTQLPADVPFKDLIEAAARRNGVDPALLAGLVKQESNFNPNARSAVGAQGLTQLMPSTARGLGVSDPTDPAQSLEAGAKFLGGLLKQFGGDERLALAAYNAGPGAVKQYGGIPPYEETQRYVPKVLGYAESFKRAGTFV
jgi:soluble lytic murein transglycosylase-like protein